MPEVTSPNKYCLFKRDLRFVDNEALFAANSGLPYYSFIVLNPLLWITMMQICVIGGLFMSRFWIYNPNSIL
jgi:hypothetical protein